MDLIVVGAGIAGSAVTRIARDRGHRVTLVSRGDPASAVAVAVMRMSWHRGAELSAAVRSLELYKQWGCKVLHGATVTNSRTPGRVHPDDDFHVVDPVAPLLNPNLVTTATVIRADSVALSTGDTLRADHVIDCRGYVPSADDMRPVLGATLVSPNVSLWAARDHVRVHHIRPYHSLVAARFPHQIRIGSSTSNDVAKCVDQVKVMLGYAEDNGIVRPSDDWRIDVGTRAKLKQGSSWYTLSPVPALRGLYRTGYSLAPAAAERLITTLERQ